MTIAEIKKCWKDKSGLFSFLFFLKSNLRKVFYKMALEYQDIFNINMIPGVQLLQILF